MPARKGRLVAWTEATTAFRIPRLDAAPGSNDPGPVAQSIAMIAEALSLSAERVRQRGYQRLRRRDLAG